MLYDSGGSNKNYLTFIGLYEKLNPYELHHFCQTFEKIARHHLSKDDASEYFYSMFGKILTQTMAEVCDVLHLQKIEKVKIEAEIMKSKVNFIEACKT